MGVLVRDRISFGCLCGQKSQRAVLSLLLRLSFTRKFNIFCSSVLPDTIYIEDTAGDWHWHAMATPMNLFLILPLHSPSFHMFLKWDSCSIKKISLRCVVHIPHADVRCCLERKFLKISFDWVPLIILISHSLTFYFMCLKARIKEEAFVVYHKILKKFQFFFSMSNFLRERIE